LLVETRLASARRVTIRRPKTRGVGRNRFVNPDKASISQTEFELRVGKEYSALLCVIARAVIYLNAYFTKLLDARLVDDAFKSRDIDVFVMSDFGFRRGREDRLRE
jgi:hypothetical protein